MRQKWHILPIRTEETTVAVGSSAGRLPLGGQGKKA
jgi:hypothetical protein